MPPASASAVNNNNSNSNNAAAAKAEREERLRSALKAFVLKEHQRKKEEFEAKEEEERQRRECEERERQNDLKLEETRSQIAKLDDKLKDLRNQKQQLSLQLKKVVNEDENRKKQQKDNELLALQTLHAQPVNVPQPQVFMPQVRVQHHQMPIVPKPIDNTPVKRGRSPSPPAHQGYYKNTNYGQPQKHDDGRRGADYTRGLWTKPQYQPGTLFYQPASNAPPKQSPIIDGKLIFSSYPLPLPPYETEMKPIPDPSQVKQTQVYISLDGSRISQTGAVSAVNSGVQTQKPQVTMEKINERYHGEVKHEGPSGHGTSRQVPKRVVYMPLPPDIMLIGGNVSQDQKSAGNMPQGYPPARSSTSAHEQHMMRQQQIMQGQAGQQQPQQLNYSRRLY